MGKRSSPWLNRGTGGVCSAVNNKYPFGSIWVYYWVASGGLGVVEDTVQFPLALHTGLLF